MSITKLIGYVVLGVFALTFVVDGWYTVPEGHVGIEKRFGKAVAQTDPGLRFKLPIIVTVEEIEVRQKKNVEELAAVTQNQLPVTATVSVNWTVDKEAAMELFIQYGGLSQFENRVLDPKLRSASKAAIARYPADELIQKRSLVATEILEELQRVTANLPISINSPQIENISLPKAYLETIQIKEQAREEAKTEQHRLDKQKLIAQQEVQTADADRDATMARADGIAYKLLTEATAEAEAIRLVSEQLRKSPTYVDLVKAKAWNGTLPRTVLSEGTGILFTVPQD